MSEPHKDERWDGYGRWRKVERNKAPENPLECWVNVYGDVPGRSVFFSPEAAREYGDRGGLPTRFVPASELERLAQSRLKELLEERTVGWARRDGLKVNNIMPTPGEARMAAEAWGGELVRIVRET